MPAPINQENGSHCNLLTERETQLPDLIGGETHDENIDDNVGYAIGYKELGVVNAVGLAVVFVTIFQCNPQWKVFDPLGPTPAHCIVDAEFFVANSIPHIIIDILIMWLPHLSDRKSVV